MELDVQSHTHLRSTVDAFHLTVQLNIQVDGLLYFSRRIECVVRCLL